MARKKIVIILLVLCGFIIIYLPGFSRLQQLVEENRSLEKKISDLKRKNADLEREIERLKTDPTYVEKIAREKLKRTKKGEIIYRAE